MSHEVPKPAEPVLEPAAREFAEATAAPPFLPDLPPAEGRRAVEEMQTARFGGPEVTEHWVAVSGGPMGTVAVCIVRPPRPAACPRCCTCTARRAGR
ncbi:hypothetical protein ACH4ZX_15455 [Streptomyces sp. NPDC020490]|uniref:hypothetical protein n=1 Tax=Streptomyces sp. NPDC020490 TaxID=3365078 RepID=UPI003792EFD6